MALGLLFAIGACVQVGAHHDVRNTPDQWYGSHPPDDGTLWIWADYGLPFSWLEVGTWESHTTPLKGYTRIDPDGVVGNLATFGALVYLVNYDRKRGGGPPY